MGSNDQTPVPDPAMTIEENCERVMKLCDAATDGPWDTARHSSPDCPVRYVIPEGSCCPVADEIASTYNNLEVNVANTDFIAASRTDLPRFVRAVQCAFKIIDDLGQGDDDNFWHWANDVREKLTRILNGDEVEYD